MSKATQTSQENGFMDPMMPEMGQAQESPETGEAKELSGMGIAEKDSPPPEGKQGRDRKAKEPEQPQEEKKGSKVHRLSRGKKPYTPQKPEIKRHIRMTVDQYLRKASQDKNISDLVRSLYRTRVMTFREWEREVVALLNKQTW